MSSSGAFQKSPNASTSAGTSSAAAAGAPGDRPKFNVRLAFLRKRRLDRKDPFQAAYFHKQQARMRRIRGRGRGRGRRRGARSGRRSSRGGRRSSRRGRRSARGQSRRARSSRSRGRNSKKSKSKSNYNDRNVYPPDFQHRQQPCPPNCRECVAQRLVFNDSASGSSYGGGVGQTSDYLDNSFDYSNNQFNVTGQSGGGPNVSFVSDFGSKYDGMLATTPNPRNDYYYHDNNPAQTSFDSNSSMWQQQQQSFDPGYYSGKRTNKDRSFYGYSTPLGGGGGQRGGRGRGGGGQNS